MSKYTLEIYHTKEGLLGWIERYGNLFGTLDNPYTKMLTDKIESNNFFESSYDNLSLDAARMMAIKFVGKEYTADNNDMNFISKDCEAKIIAEE